MELLRGRRAEGHRGGHRRRASRRRKTWIKESIDLQRELVEKAGVRAPLEYDAGARLRRRRVRARSRPSAPTQLGQGEHHRRQGRAQRGHRRGHAPRSSPQLAPSAVRGPREGGQGGGPLAHQEARPQAHRRRGRPHRRPRPDRPASGVGRGRRHPHRPRLGPVPAGRDPGAQRRSRSACRGWTSCSTPSAPKTKKRYMHHYNMPPYANGETGPRGLARSAARSATACSPSGPCCRSCRAQEEFPYTLRLVSEVLSSNGSTSMALGVRVVAVADGRRRADQGAGRRHRHGPRLRRRQVHDAHRHPRRRGRLRRHGLQGRRHGRVRHRAAARHQDRRPPRRRARPPRCSRPATPACRSSR